MTGAKVLSPPSIDFDARRWAAEELALELGWLSECPYHGEPLKTAAAGGVAVSPSALLAVDGSTDLYFLALKVSRSYAEHCPFCIRENALAD